MYGSGTSSTSTIRTDEAVAPAATALSTASDFAWSSAASRVSWSRENDPLDFAADLSDRRADRVGDGEVVGPNETGGARQRVAEQNAAASDDDDRDRVGAGLHPIDRLREHPLRPRRDRDRRDRHRDRRRRDGSPNEARPPATARSLAVSVSPPNTSARVGSSYPTLSGTDRRLVAADEGAAAETEREDVRHAEVRPHAADVDRHGRLARKAVLQYAYIGCGAADVDDRTVFAGPERSAAPRIEFVGPEANVATG